jgi:hypothetical protein
MDNGAAPLFGSVSLSALRERIGRAAVTAIAVLVLREESFYSRTPVSSSVLLMVADDDGAGGVGRWRERKRR